MSWIKQWMREDECECVILAIQASYQLLMPRPRIYNPPPHPHYFMSQPAVPEKKWPLLLRPDINSNLVLHFYSPAKQATCRREGGSEGYNWVFHMPPKTETARAPFLAGGGGQRHFTPLHILPQWMKTSTVNQFLRKHSYHSLHVLKFQPRSGIVN